MGTRRRGTPARTSCVWGLESDLDLFSRPRLAKSPPLQNRGGGPLRFGLSSRESPVLRAAFIAAGGRDVAFLVGGKQLMPPLALDGESEGLGI